MKKLILLSFVVSSMAMAEPNGEEQCKVYLDATLPTIKDMASGAMPAPSESVEKSKAALELVNKLVEKQEFCNAYQAILNAKK